MCFFHFCHRPPTLHWVWLLTLSLGLSAQAQVTTRQDPVGTLLNQWYSAGTAAGLSAITYENRDDQHSPLNAPKYPQLEIFKHDATSGAPKGLASQLRLRPTVGNCSMAAGATQGGSLPRLYQMEPRGPQFQMLQYLANNLMIYPEHQDHDIGANGVGGYGDLFPINNLYSIISQGSSLSDMPFVEAVLSTIAAFPPETQEMLIKQRVLMPTVQSIFRKSNKMVVNELDYFSGNAHPVVFDSVKLDEEKMVQLAHEMTPAKIPPLVQISAVDETELLADKDFFEKPNTLTHKLADTPMSIARVMRGSVDEYGMLLFLGKTADLMKRPVKIMLQVLQGDPKLVRLDYSGKSPYARLRVRWHPPMITATGIRSNRVDIAVFASNGISVSAPAIISFFMLPNERRFYDQRGSLTEIEYQAANPDIGLPLTSKDTRWLRAMLDVSIAGDGVRSQLIAQLLTNEERMAIQAVWLPLNKRLQVINSLEKDPVRKDAAMKMKADLETDLAAALDNKLPGGRGLTVRSAIARSLDTLSTFPDLYFSYQKKLTTLATNSTKPSATADIRNEIRRLVDLGILIEQASGKISTATAPDKLSPAERHYLRELNLTVLSQVLFPEALDRSIAPAWVDPRLTTPKPWRDVFRYDETTSQRLGWIRYQAGHTYWFDTQGRLLREGPKHPDKAVPVKYESNATGQLEWR